jgi:hypothetical protein
MSTDNPNDTPPAPPAADVGALLAKTVQLESRLSALEGRNVGLAETVRLQARRIEALEAAAASPSKPAARDVPKGPTLRNRAAADRVLPSARK